MKMQTCPQMPWQRPPGEPSPAGRLLRCQVGASEQDPAAAASSSPAPALSSLGQSSLLGVKQREIKTLWTSRLAAPA